MLKREIAKELKKIVGKFSYELIYENTEQKNYVYLIRTIKNLKKHLKMKLKEELFGKN
jgi:hypothetical protein